MNSPVRTKEYYLAQATSNTSTPAKAGVSEKPKTIVLNVGLVVVSVGAALFNRRIYAPDKKNHPEFFVTDIVGYIESGEKVLITASGNCMKAGEFGDAFEDLVNRDGESFAEAGMLDRSATHCLVKLGPLEDQASGVYRQGYFEDVELKEFHRSNGYSKVYSYQFPAMAKLGSAVHVHAAAKPLPAVQHPDHEAEFGHWSTWNGAKQVVDVVLTEYERLILERDKILSQKAKSAMSSNASPAKRAKLA